MIASPFNAINGQLRNVYHDRRDRPNRMVVNREAHMQSTRCHPDVFVLWKKMNLLDEEYFRNLNNSPMPR
jgi:hypothetical protein